MKRLLPVHAAFLLFAASGCGATIFDSEGEPETGVVAQAVSCGPQMNVFPVQGPHNIGYDAASCGSGTCAISCPDEHANSDWGGAHHGIDVFAWQRAPEVAVADGTIVAVGVVSSTSGLRVRLRDDCGWEYYYGHLDQAIVSVGQRVSAGQQIGYMGHTGTASTHLHFNVSPDGGYSNDINPFALLTSTSATACALPPPPPPPPSPPPGCGGLTPGQSLGAGELVGSCDGRFALAMQTDGNVVLYQAGVGAIWHTHTNGTAGQLLAMQTDGNLVLYTGAGRPLWHTHTNGRPGAWLAVQTDGNLVVYDGGTALWDSGTWGR